MQERRAWGKGAYLYTDVGDASGEMQCGEMQWRDASASDASMQVSGEMQINASGACAHYTFIQHVPCKNKHNHDICIKTSVLIPCCQMGCMFCINFVTSDSLLKLIVCIVYCFLRSGGKKLGNVSMLIKTVSF